MDFSIECDEVPKQGQTIEGKNLLISDGGKGANQALACQKLGANVLMIGSVGNDAFAPALINNLKSHGINTENIKISSNCSSGTAFIIRSNNDNRIIINKGANHSIDENEIKEILNTLYKKGEIKKDDIFIAQFECDIKATFEALKLAKELGLFTIFNPAPAKEIDKDIYKYIDLFIVNQSEAEFYTNINTDTKACLKALLDLGAREIILTLSSDGSAYKNKEVEKFFKAYKVNPIDTTAAGDTFIGALAASLANAKTIDEAIDFGSKAAALSTLKLGAQSSIPNIDEVNNFSKDTKWKDQL